MQNGRNQRGDLLANVKTVRTVNAFDLFFRDRDISGVIFQGPLFCGDGSSHLLRKPDMTLSALVPSITT